MEFRTRLNFDDVDMQKSLEALAANSHLSVFVQLSVEAYLSSDEGKQIFKVLVGNGSKKRTRKGDSRKVEDRNSDRLKTGGTKKADEPRPCTVPAPAFSAVAAITEKAGTEALEATHSVLTAKISTPARAPEVPPGGLASPTVINGLFKRTP